jgi:CubicO group peptidase (beta-lactamase class C family)
MKVKQKTTIGRKGLCLIVVTVLLTSPFITYAQDNPLAKYLDVPGAKTTLPVSIAKAPFSLEFAQDAQKRFENFHYQLGGDHALYYNMNLSEVLHTAVSKPNDTYRPLEKKLRPEIGDKVSFTVKEGELTLNEYVVHPNHRVQAVVMIHKGKIVYESYPGMNPTDLHAWMSPGKTTVALVIAQLEAEGKIDMSKEVVEYLPDFKGTNWDGITMIDAANMATALQLEETMEAIVDPSSIIVKFFSAEFGSPNPSTGKVDDWLEILKGAEKIEGEDPGYRFRYSSAVTQTFVVIAERIEDKTWAEIFQERVWGNMTARSPMLAPSYSGWHFGRSWAVVDYCRGFCKVWHVVHAQLGKGRCETCGIR